MATKILQEEGESSLFIQQLIEKASDFQTFTSDYLFLPDLEEGADAPSLLHILGMEEKDLSQVAKETISHLEDEKDAAWVSFKWKLLAFLSVQDIFDGRLIGGDWDSMFRLWYFFYESKYLLIETMLCGFNGFYSASRSLLRPFLEFSLLQNYYHRLSRETGSFNSLDRYRETQRSPSWNTILRRALPQDEFSKPIRNRLQIYLQSLSLTSTHSYYPDFSPRQTFSASTTPGPTLEGVCFWYHTAFVLDAALWLYEEEMPSPDFPKFLSYRF